MVTNIFNPPRTRFAVSFYMTVIMLTGFTLLRTALLIRAWPVINHNLFELLHVFGQGFIYDMAFIGYFQIPFIILLLVIPNKWISCTSLKTIALGMCFLIIYGLCFGIVAEWFFWDEFGVRFNFISIDYLIYRREVTENILQSYPVFWILPILFVTALFIFYPVRKSLLNAMTVREKFAERLVISFALLMIPVSSVLFLNQTQRNVSDNNYMIELASNGPYQLFAAFRNNTLDYRQFYETGNDKALSDLLKNEIQEEDSQYYSKALYNISRHVEENEPPKKLNVMLITVESLSADFLTRFGEKKNITPFMDDWFKQGKLFTNFYATGTRTTRGLEALTLSIPPTPGRSIVKRPDNRKMYTLGKVFKDMGYDTAFLYGGRGYFDNMNAFFSGNGYRIVDQTSLSDTEITFQNAWGICDEDLYNRAIQEADKAFGENLPFFYHVMTTSNHQPFTYPDGKIDLPPGEGGSGSGRDGGVKYTDFALSRFIETAKNQPWFEDTLFVMVADHCAASAGKIGLPVEKYHIPLFIYAPKYIEPEEINILSSQIDLPPTLLSLLHFSYDSFFFGKNILAPGFRGRAFIANYQKLGILSTKELLILSPGKTISFIDTSSRELSLEKANSLDPFVSELMSYYQGADYILRNKLNRWSDDTTVMAAK